MHTYIPAKLVAGIEESFQCWTDPVLRQMALEPNPETWPGWNSSWIHIDKVPLWTQIVSSFRLSVSLSPCLCRTVAKAHWRAGPAILLQCRWFQVRMGAAKGKNLTEGDVFRCLNIHLHWCHTGKDHASRCWDCKSLVQNINKTVNCSQEMLLH